jgi:hypothetical protein
MFISPKPPPPLELRHLYVSQRLYNQLNFLYVFIEKMGKREKVPLTWATVAKQQRAHNEKLKIVEEESNQIWEDILWNEFIVDYFTPQNLIDPVTYQISYSSFHAAFSAWCKQVKNFKDFYCERRQQLLKSLEENGVVFTHKEYIQFPSYWNELVGAPLEEEASSSF